MTTILPLVIAPDPRLKTRSAPVEAVTEEIHALAQAMLETMYHERGIGLAAVQVGVLKRVLVADVEWKDDGARGTQWVLINPEIVSDGGEMNVYKEGCLSFPDQYADVERPRGVRVKYLGLDGAVREEEFTGLLATCIQHEIDHLNGITFPDHLSTVKRDIILRKMKKIKKQIEDDHHHHHDHDHVHGEHCNH
jgi:peptide deformylase